MVGSIQAYTTVDPSPTAPSCLRFADKTGPADHFAKRVNEPRRRGSGRRASGNHNDLSPNLGQSYVGQSLVGEPSTGRALLAQCRADIPPRRAGESRPTSGSPEPWRAVGQRPLPEAESPPQGSLRPSRPCVRPARRSPANGPGLSRNGVQAPPAARRPTVEKAKSSVEGSRPPIQSRGPRRRPASKTLTAPPLKS